MSRAVFSSPEGLCWTEWEDFVLKKGVPEWFDGDGFLRSVHRVQSEADAGMGREGDARSESPRAQLIFDFDL